MTELLLLLGVEPALTTGLFGRFVVAAVHVGHACKIFLISGDSSATGGFWFFWHFRCQTNIVVVKSIYNPKKMSQPSFQAWNYFVLKVNITEPGTPPSPEKASEKLKGTLSPAFIQDQFPNEYKEIKQDESIEVQLQKILAKLGAQGWELVEVFNISSKFLFFFKRPESPDSE